MGNVPAIKSVAPTPAVITFRSGIPVTAVSVSSLTSTNLTKERKGLMDLTRLEPTKQYDDAERLFLKNQAQELMNNNQPCELHTRTQGSIYRGRVLQADEGESCSSTRMVDASSCPS